MTSWQAGGLIVGFAGAVLIFTPWHTAGSLFSAGGLECLAASVSYAISYIYMDRFLARRGIGPVVLSACQLAAAVMLAVALAVSGVQTPHVTATSASIDPLHALTFVHHANRVWIWLARTIHSGNHSQLSMEEASPVSV